MLLHDARELTRKRDRHAREPVEVLGGELDVEVVRDDGAPAGDDRRVLIELTLEVAGDLHGLDVGTEGLGERAIDHALELALEAVQNAHCRPPPRRRADTCSYPWRVPPTRPRAGLSGGPAGGRPRRS